jgi:hypothetical protein
MAWLCELLPLSFFLPRKKKKADDLFFVKFFCEEWVLTVLLTSSLLGVSHHVRPISHVRR